jgi:hypothetical protein
LRIPFHLLRCWCNTCTNHITNDMIHFISSCDHVGSILTSLALLRCLGPSMPSHHSTCPSHLHPAHQAKSCRDLLHLDHMTQCRVSCAMRSFITCVSFATSPSHLHHHGICCSHTCTCGLIICVSHINTISPPKVVTQLPKPNKDPRHLGVPSSAPKTISKPIACSAQIVHLSSVEISTISKETETSVHLSHIT